MQRLAPLTDGPAALSWQDAVPSDVPTTDLESSPLEPARFAPLPKAATTPRAYDGWKRALVTSLYATQTLDLLVHPASKLHQRPGESEGEFRVRVQEHLHEARDAAVDALRTKFASRIATQADRVRQRAQAIEREQADVTQTGLQTVVTTLTGWAGAFFGRKAGSATNVGRLGTAARSAGRTVQAQQDVARARANHEAEREKLATLERDLEEAVQDLQARYGQTGALDTVTLRPKRSDIAVQALTLVWVPSSANADGTSTSLAD